MEINKIMNYYFRKEENNEYGRDDRVFKRTE